MLGAIGWSFKRMLYTIKCGSLGRGGHATIGLRTRQRRRDGLLGFVERQPALSVPNGRAQT